MGPSKLTEADVLAIHDAYANGAFRTDIAAQYGVSVSTVQDIMSGLIWSYLGRVTPVRRHRGEFHGMAKLSAADVLAICETYDRGGIFQKDLAEQYGVVQSLVSSIILGKCWGHVTGRSPTAKKLLA